MSIEGQGIQRVGGVTGIKVWEDVVEIEEEEAKMIWLFKLSTLKKEKKSDSVPL